MFPAIGARLPLPKYTTGVKRTRRRGDTVTRRPPCPRVSASPNLPVSASPNLLVPASPRLPVCGTRDCAIFRKDGCISVRRHSRLQRSQPLGKLTSGGGGLLARVRARRRSDRRRRRLAGPDRGTRTPELCRRGELAHLGHQLQIKPRKRTSCQARTAGGARRRRTVLRRRSLDTHNRSAEAG